jgi:putative FmdB family regulatory protein
MPTYQYHCPDCGHDFEEFQSITEEPIGECPKCGKKPHRVISGGAGFVLKGTGFYATDYRSSEYKKEASKDGPLGSAASSTSTSTTKDKAKDKTSSKPKDP